MTLRLASAAQTCMPRALRLAAVAGLVALCVVGQTAGAQGGAPDDTARRVIVVLDSSAAMLAPLDGFKKYYPLRRALGPALASVPPNLEFGLIAYGQRRRTACDDVEQIQPLEAFDAQRFLRAATGLRPKGQAPVSEALKLAATTLGAAPGAGGRILLVAGAADSCQQDPCATATQIVAANPKLSIDVLGVGLSETDRAQFSCIAAAAHGRLFLASAMADVEPALRTALAGLATMPTLELPAANIEIPAKARGLHLTARLADDSAPYPLPITWIVRKSPLEGQPPAIAFKTEAAAAVADLPPGRYDVEASAGLVTLHRPAEITPDAATDLVITLDAGAVRLQATAAKSDDPLEDVFFTVYRLDDDAEVPIQSVALVRGPAQSLLLPSGNYRIAAEHGGLRIEHRVSIAAGKDVAFEFAMAMGLLQIEAPAANAGTDAGSPTYFVSEDDPAQPLGQRDVARSAAINPSFDLAPGAYHVLARQGAAQVRLDTIVKAGETTKLSLPMATGRLRLATIGLENISDLPEDLISYTVERLDSAGARTGVIARSSRMDATLELETGPYRVTGRIGSVNVVASSDAEVKPGIETSIALQQRVALIDLRYEDGGASSGDVFWEIRATDGTILWSSVGPALMLALAPGDYDVHALRAGREQTTPVRLAPGERKFVAIRPER